MQLLSMFRLSRFRTEPFREPVVQKIGLQRIRASKVIAALACDDGLSEAACGPFALARRSATPAQNILEMKQVRRLSQCRGKPRTTNKINAEMIAAMKHQTDVNACRAKRKPAITDSVISTPNILTDLTDDSSNGTQTIPA